SPPQLVVVPRCARCSSELCRDRLLIASNDAYCCPRMWTVAESINRSHTLPGRGGHKTFPQHALGREPRAGPIAPRVFFRSVYCRQALQTITKQLIHSVSSKLLPRATGRLGARLAFRKQI